MPKNFQKYFAAVKYLESIQNLPQDDYFIKKTGRSIFLKRLEYFFNQNGNPHKNLKYIHIGGTSGKGSVANMIQSILTEAGFKTGLYTSPYPTTSIEKIKINNLLIDPEEFVKIVESLKPAIDKTYVQSPYGRPSYFEIFTAIAFVYFKKQKCDYVVLEVGLGGRHDATNIIPTAKITIINKIDYDHTELLGKTLSQIAREKAAIIKPKTTFFTTSQNNNEVLKIFKKTCEKNHAEFNLVDLKNSSYQLNLLGKHQKCNAELAKAAAKKLGVSEEKIKAGLSKTKMSCRTEIIQKNPMVILDGAHNVSKIKTTVETIKNLTYKKLYIIIALTNERNANQIFKEVVSLADYLFITRFQNTAKKCYPPLKMMKKLNLKKPAKVFLDPQMALNQALKIANKEDLILITGSFYLAGELRKHWRSETSILERRKI
jgi:dihydrofolate synthase/folylpolyglutamate synthase